MIRTAAICAGAWSTHYALCMTQAQWHMDLRGY